MKKPLILITNDDGITAPGLEELVNLMCTIAEVIVVAPNSPQSGMSHAITLDNILHFKEVAINTESGKIKGYSCSGTPADCVKLGLKEILDRKPDLVLSGINHGSNSAINVIYSGTMSAAIEAGIKGIPAIGFSLCDFSWEADFSATRKTVLKIVSEALKNGIPEGTVLNVNIPKTDGIEPKGIKICKQAKANWNEKFEKRSSPTGKEYYWLTGEFELLDDDTETDIHALNSGYVSVVPVQFDLTAYKAINEITNWNLNA